MAKNEEPLRPDIAAAKARLKSTLGSKREIRKLADHLWEGEVVEQFVAGTYGTGQGLVTLTDRRLLFTFDGFLNAASEDFPLDKISSIQWKSGMLLGTIMIFASGNKAELTNVDKQLGKELVEVIRDRLQHRLAVVDSQLPLTSASTLDIPDQIRKLKDLLLAGILDDAEFTAKKTELLRRM